MSMKRHSSTLYRLFLALRRPDPRRGAYLGVRVHFLESRPWGPLSVEEPGVGHHLYSLLGALASPWLSVLPRMSLAQTLWNSRLLQPTATDPLPYGDHLAARTHVQSWALPQLCSTLIPNDGNSSLLVLRLKSRSHPSLSLTSHTHPSASPVSSTLKYMQKLMVTEGRSVAAWNVGWGRNVRDTRKLLEVMEMLGIMIVEMALWVCMCVKTHQICQEFSYNLSDIPLSLVLRPTHNDFHLPM